MKFSMQLLFGISLLIVFVWVDKVRSYNASEVDKLVPRFAEFAAKLQEKIKRTDSSQEALAKYKTLKFADVPTVKDFEQATRNLINDTLQKITPQDLRPHLQIVEQAIQLLCSSTDGFLSEQLQTAGGIQYQKTPLRTDIFALYLKTLAPGTATDTTAYAAAKTKFDTSLCLLTVSK